MDRQRKNRKALPGDNSAERAAVSRSAFADYETLVQGNQGKPVRDNSEMDQIARRVIIYFVTGSKYMDYFRVSTCRLSCIDLPKIYTAVSKSSL